MRSVPWFLLTALLVTGSLSAQPSHAPAPGPHTYRNNRYGFSLTIPSGLTASPLSAPWSIETLIGRGGRSGTPLVSVVVFHVNRGPVATGKPYPLFFTAEVRVGVSRDTSECYQPVPARGGRSSSGVLTTIHGVTFRAFPVESAGMMKYLVAVSYRVVHDHRCYAVEQLERGSSYRDSSMKPGLSRAQLDAYYAEAGRIAHSFRFLAP